MFYFPLCDSFPSLRPNLLDKHFAIDENLDISWLRDEDENGDEELPEPTALAQEAMIELEAAIAELQGILAELGEEVVEL